VRIPRQTDGFNILADHANVAEECSIIPQRVNKQRRCAGAGIYVDGWLVGAVPYRGVLPEGEHEHRVVAEGYEPQTQTVVLATGEERIDTVALAAPSGTHAAWLWSLVGLAGAAPRRGGLDAGRWPRKQIWIPAAAAARMRG
jgi:hypothetical protein